MRYFTIVVEVTVAGSSVNSLANNKISSCRILHERKSNSEQAERENRKAAVLAKCNSVRGRIGRELRYARTHVKEKEVERGGGGGGGRR